MSDPLDYMNRFSQWPTPPPFDGKWAAALGRACDELASKDAQLAAERQLREAAEVKAAWLAKRLDEMKQSYLSAVEERVGVEKTLERLLALLAPAAETPIISRPIGDDWRMDKAPEEPEDEEGAGDGN